MAGLYVPFPSLFGSPFRLKSPPHSEVPPFLIVGRALTLSFHRSFSPDARIPVVSGVPPPSLTCHFLLCREVRVWIPSLSLLAMNGLCVWSPFATFFRRGMIFACIFTGQAVPPSLDGSRRGQLLRPRRSGQSVSASLLRDVFALFVGTLMTIPR